MGGESVGVGEGAVVCVVVVADDGAVVDGEVLVRFAFRIPRCDESGLG